LLREECKRIEPHFQLLGKSKEQRRWRNNLNTSKEEAKGVLLIQVFPQKNKKAVEMRFLLIVSSSRV
jgi:hypothetical protein